MVCGFLLSHAKVEPPSSSAAGLSAGEGHMSLIKPIILPLPIFLVEEQQNTGKICWLAKAMVKPFDNSSSVRVPDSKNFSIRPSSFSAAASTNALCSAMALSISAAGISFLTGLPPLAGNSYNTILKVSMMLLNPVP